MATSPHKVIIFSGDTIHTIELKSMNIVPMAPTPTAAPVPPRIKSDAIHEKDMNKKAQQVTEQNIAIFESKRQLTDQEVIKEEQAMQELQKKLELQEEKFNAVLLSHDSNVLELEGYRQRLVFQKKEEKCLDKEITDFEATEKADRAARIQIAKDRRAKTTALPSKS